MKKRILSLLMACATVISCCSVVAMAASTDVAETPTIEVNDGAIFEIIEGVQDPYEGGITRDSYIAVDETLSAVNGSQTVTFRTSSDYPYYRIYVSNTGSSAYNITLTNASGDNQLVNSPIVLRTGKSTNITNENAASGMRFLTVTSKDGSRLSGVVRVRLASSADELG